MGEPASSNRRSAAADVDVGELLTVRRITVGLEATSKKRLLEQVTDLLIADEPELDKQVVLQVLNDRERLGSTGIGHGVALPHARLEGLAAPLGAFALLAAPVPFDAVDHEPVELVFALLVPNEATSEHLRILARLAELFSNPAVREHLRGCREPADALAVLRGRPGQTPPA